MFKRFQSVLPILGNAFPQNWNSYMLPGIEKHLHFIPINCQVTSSVVIGCLEKHHRCLRLFVARIDFDNSRYWGKCLELVKFQKMPDAVVQFVCFKTLIYWLRGETNRACWFRKNTVRFLKTSRPGRFNKFRLLYQKSHYKI